MISISSPIRYDDSLETRRPDEEELIDKIAASLERTGRRTFDKHRHAIRGAHAKSHGILRGELIVYGGLPEPLRQGAFREARTYPVIVRLSTAPGDLWSDEIPAPRGMAIKLLGVEGRQVLPQFGAQTTQDFLLVNMPVIPFGDVASYWVAQQILEKQADVSETVKRLVTALAGQANRLLSLLGHPSPTLYGISPPNTHILGETFHSMAALRYGEYVAKLSAAPLSPSVRQLTGKPVDASDNPSVLRDLVLHFFRTETAEYELRAQLCTDLPRMPIEDASVEWPAELSPHQPIARLILPPQDTYSPARRVYADEVLSFNPWHAIEEHRPLGSIMRVRSRAYAASSELRHELNQQPLVEPQDIRELPD